MAEILENVNLSLGSEKKIHKKEIPIRRWAFRSIISIRDIKKGEKIKKDMIWSKRPGTGIPSYKMNKIIGKRVIRNLKKNTMLKMKDLK